MLDRAIALASKVFEGKHDKGGKPYILHCLHVMYGVINKGANEDTAIAAVLHDVIEDTDYTLADLADMGYNIDVLYILDLLTHRKTDTYKVYIKKISNSRQATMIKMEDLQHNSDITRLKGLRKKDFERLEKYIEAYTYLKD